MSRLFLDAAPGKFSRTRRLSEAVTKHLGGEWNRRNLYEKEIPILTEEKLSWRVDCCHRQEYSDAYFDDAKEFLQAEEIVICAPFWDSSFPSVLKSYLESVCISNLTFRYSPEGIPTGLCRASRVIYVTTAGGRVFDYSFGFGYVKDLCTGLLGIPESVLISAEGLDVVGNDPEKILEQAIRRIPEKLK